MKKVRLNLCSVPKAQEEKLRETLSESVNHEVCGGDDMGEGGAAQCLDIIVAGSRARPLSSHGRSDQ